jgi:hypothetical protein
MAVDCQDSYVVDYSKRIGMKDRAESTGKRINAVTQVRRTGSMPGWLVPSSRKRGRSVMSPARNDCYAGFGYPTLSTLASGSNARLAVEM